MRLKLACAAVLAAALISAAALAQYAPGMQNLTSLIGPILIPVVNGGAATAAIPVNGGTFTCSGGAATVANTNVNAGSLVLMTLKTVGGTVAAPYVATITSGTGFTVTCGGSDTSVYNYVILG
jgi:hypothetical protein